MNDTVKTEVAEVASQIALIDTDDKLSLQLLAKKFNELATRVNQAPAGRNRGPRSERSMTEEDARKIMLGDLKDASHKEAAAQLGLSYGQVYSARNGFTFKPVYKEMKTPKKAA